MNLQHHKIASLLVCALATSVANALPQQPATPGTAPAASPQAPGANRLTPSELEELLGPIALYPDVLLANVLAASVYPDEVFAAAKFVAGGGKADQIPAQSWEDPVKAVAQIPDAIKMMGEYKDWTIALGQAYIVQAKDVMDVVQTLRKKAQDTGALTTTPQQKVVVKEKDILILPADPEIIYVPVYNPQVVYVQNTTSTTTAGLIGFGLGITAGLIIANNMDCHWHSGYVGWGYHGGYYNGGNYYNNSRGGNTVNINGDVNIGRGNGNTINAGNRVGNEGNAWAPNRNKPIASQQPSRLGQYNGGATTRPAVPNTTAAANRPAQAGGANPAARPNTPATMPANRPNTPAAAPANRPATPTTTRMPNVPPTPPREPSPSALRGSSDSAAASQRGAASRSNSGSSGSRSGGAATRPSGGAARPSGGGGGASRGGGGGGRSR